MAELKPSLHGHVYLDNDEKRFPVCAKGNWDSTR